MFSFCSYVNMAAGGRMTGPSTAQILQRKLTEQGLVRTLAKQDVSPQLVHRLSIEEAARALQRGMAHPGASHKLARKAKKAKKAEKAKSSMKYATPKAAKSVPKASKGHAVVRQVQPNYWRRVKKELHILICTDDKKYASIRRQIGKENKLTQAAIVTGIGGAIGACVGVSATVIGPFVTLGLYALIQVGTNAWCAGTFE
jgi:hypothetical protein